MTAREVGVIGDAGTVGGDEQAGPAWCRTFLTRNNAGRLVRVGVTAYAVELSPDPETGAPRWDVLEQTDEETFGDGVTPAEAEAFEAEPFDMETTYAHPIDYWRPEPDADAASAAARAHIERLPAAWLDAMPTP